MRVFKKTFTLIIKKTDLGSAVAVRLTKYTGKSKVPIHPKHFLTQKPWFISGIKKTDVVLDLGSGNGQNAIKLAKKCKKVVAVELDDNLIKIAKKSANDHNVVNIEFVKANLEKKLPFKNNSFDRVIFLDVLEHLYKRELSLKEISRTLKRDGKLFIGVPNSDTSWKKFQRSAGVNSFSDPDHKIEFSIESISKLLTKTGFKIINFGYGNYDIPLRGLIDIFGAISLDFYKWVNKIRTRESIKHPSEASGFEIIAQKVK